MLLSFFVPSVALSRVGRARKKQLTDIGKGGARDAWQVLANGGVATLAAVIAGARGGDQRWAAAFAGAYAAATADTWGTEIGTLARGRPRSILTLRPIATGLSGGITVAGTAAEVAGAAWIAICAARLLQTREAGSNESPSLFPILVGGVFGAFVDSLLGATVQELRYCPACERGCETNPHSCGAQTTRIRGMTGFSNDLVNFAATFKGAAAAFLLER